MNLNAAFGLVTVFLLVLTNGFFVATEFAIVAVRRSKLDEAARLGSHAAEAAQDVVRHLDSYLAACQLGITIASLALGWVGEPAIAHLIEPPLMAIGDKVAPALSHTVAIAISFASITTMHIVLGEQAAKGLALQKTEAVALFVSPPMRIMFKVLKWPILVLNAICNRFLGMFGLKSAWGGDMAYSVDELRLLLSSSREAGFVEPSEAKIASRAFEFSDITAGSLMTPRTELDAVPASLSLDELVGRARAASHTRLLVYADSLDDVIGVIHVRDLLKVMDSAVPFGLASLMRPVLTVPESKRADALLEEMKATRCYVAMIIEEFGGTAGVVTLRDIVGGLVGHIEKEPPALEEPLAPPAATDGELVLDGLLRLQEFEEISGITLDGLVDGRAETLGGLIMALLGNVPGAGDRVLVLGRTLEVVRMDGMRVELARLHPRRATVELSDAPA